MPFANLPPHEKDAFFALLDEYFTSRPDLLSRVGGAAATVPGQGHQGTQAMAISPAASAAALTSVAQHALANPAASRMLASGIQRAATTGAGGGGRGHPAASVAPLAAAAALPSLVNAASRNNSAGDRGANPNANAPSAGPGFGRVAAAAQAFSSPSTKPANPSGPTSTQRKFGDVDVSSPGAMFRSLRGSTAAKNAPPAPVYTSPAFSGKKSSSEFAPPPVRRVPASAPAAPEPEEEAQPEPEEEEANAAAGAWAEALYDYTSKEAGDLHLQAGERVWVTEQTSSDWWTGQVDDRSGLFPATYVKLL